MVFFDNLDACRPNQKTGNMGVPSVRRPHSSTVLLISHLSARRAFGYCRIIIPDLTLIRKKGISKKTLINSVLPVDANSYILYN